HAMEKISRHRIETQAEEIPDLRTGDQNSDAVGESDDDGARKIFHGGAHARDTQEQKKNAGHHRANEEASDSVLGNDSRNDNDKRTGRADDVRFGAAQRRNQKSSDNGAIKTCLWRETRRNRESHRERKRDKADGDSSNEIGLEFMAVVVAQQDYGFR